MVLDPAIRYRVLSLAGVEVRARHVPGEPYRYKHGWIPVAAGLDDLRDAVASGEKVREELSGGQMGDVALVTHNNGTQTIHKVLRDVSDTMGPGYEPERQADAEELSAILGHAIGAPVPRVHRVAPDEIYTDVVPGEVAVGIKGHLFAAARTPEEFQSVQRRAAEATAKIVGTDDGIRLGLFDILTGNWDRSNESNWMVTPDGLPVGIDHSFAFEDGSPGPSAPKPNAIGPFALHYLHIETQPGPSWLHEGTSEWDSNPLTPDDIAWLRQRLAEVRPDFQRLGRDDWWEFASARLEALAPYAAGRKSRFAP